MSAGINLAELNIIHYLMRTLAILPPAGGRTEAASLEDAALSFLPGEHNAG
jgi:hypothetical protein